MPKTAFLFPGQGAQTVGMAKDLCERIPEARRRFEEASEILGYDLFQVCQNGPAESLNSTAVSQPAIFVASIAALELVKQEHPQALEECEGTAGLSLGEYTALVFAGAMTFTEGLRVVKRRGEAMQAASDRTPSGMVSVLGPDRQQVEELCDKAKEAGFIQIANLLCPGNTVVSGVMAACERIQQLAEGTSARTVKLPVAGAFHTHLMKPADEELGEALKAVEVRNPRIPVWSNVDAQAHESAEEIRVLLVRQVVEPVQMEPLLRSLFDAGFERFYEIGPGRVLAGLLKRVQRKVDCVNVTV